MRHVSIGLALSLVITVATPAYAEDAPPLERVESLRLLSALTGAYPAARPNFLGMPNMNGKLFRLNGDNANLVRGIGQDNDFLEFLWPSNQIRPELRRTLAVSPQATTHLQEADSLLGTASLLEWSALGLGVGGMVLLLGGLANGFGAPGSMGPTLVTAGVGTLAAGSILRIGVSDFGFTMPAYGQIDKAVEAYNRDMIRPASVKRR